MKATTRRRIAMARRALDFAQAHPLTDTGYTAVVARLKDEVDRADSIGMLQSAGIAREHSAVTRRADVRQDVRSQHLVRLARLAQLAGAEHPELLGLFKLPPSGGPSRVFLLKTRQMLADATTQKDLLTSLGLGDTFIDELTQSVADFDAVTEAAHAARADHVGASAELERLANACSTEVAVIDTFMRRNYVNDPMTLAAWRSAKNLAGPFAPAKTAPPAPAAPEPVTPTPVLPQPIAPEPPVVST